MATPRSRSIMRVALATGLAVLIVACASASPATTPSTTPAAATTTPTAEPTPSVTPSSAPSPDTTVGDGEAWIAFQSTNGSGLIDLVRPDGTGRHRLFPLIPGGEQQHPDWSPDGQRLVVSVQGVETEVIWVGDADGSNTSLLVDCAAPCQWVDEPAWSPDGKRIAYHRMVSQDGVGVSTLEILDLATMMTRVAYTAPTQRANYAPRWNGDGTNLVFEHVVMTSPAFDADVTGAALAILDLTDADAMPREITNVGDRCNNPDWSWVNDTIICSKPVSTTSFDGPSDIVSVRSAKGAFFEITAIAAEGKQAVMPTWLPDGSGVILGDWGGMMSTIDYEGGTGMAPAISGSVILGLHPRVRPTP